MKQKYIERELWIAPAEDSIKKYKEKKIENERTLPTFSQPFDMDRWI